MSGIATTVARMRGTLDVVYREMLKFGAVGAVAFVVDVGLFNLMRTGLWFGAGNPGSMAHEKLAKTISVIVATVVAWLGNRYWTFRHRRQTSRGREFVPFVLMKASAMVIALACLGLSHDVFGFTSGLADNLAGNVIGLGLGHAVPVLGLPQLVFTELLDPQGRDRADGPCRPAAPGRRLAGAGRRRADPQRREAGRTAAARSRMTCRSVRGGQASAVSASPRRHARPRPGRRRRRSPARRRPRSRGRTPGPCRSPAGSRAWRSGRRRASCGRSPPRSRRGRHCLPRRDHAVDHAQRAGLGRVDPPGGEDELGGAGHPDPARQQLRAAEAGDHPDGHLGQADDGGLVRDHQVAEQGELEATPEGVARDGRHHRHRDGEERRRHPPVDDALRAQLLVGVPVPLLEVRPDAEGPGAARRQDDRAQVVVRGQRREGGGQLPGELGGDGVQGVRTVDDHVREGPRRYRSSPSARSTRTSALAPSVPLKTGSMAPNASRAR